MRITNIQKTAFLKILSEINLNKNLFNYSGEDDIYSIKFKENYFEFAIRKINNSAYEVSIKSTHIKTNQTHRCIWETVVKLFENWAKEIAEDVSNASMLVEFIKTEKNFPKEIAKYSKNFINIYNQAYVAEINNLNEICGLGYRKAFEFLIKDYLIKKNKKELHSQIKELPISNCINQYVTSDEIKLLSHRILWLGNDHAHYIKKWKDKTLLDLKKLIDLTIQWIRIKDELENVHKSMPKGKK